MKPEKCLMSILSSAYGRARGSETHEEGDTCAKENPEDHNDADHDGDDGDDDNDGDDGDDEDGGDCDDDGEDGNTDSNDVRVDCEGSGGTHQQANDPNFDIDKAGQPSVEPNFGTEFWEATPEELQSLVTMWSSAPLPNSMGEDASAHLRLPDANIFLATDFSLRPLPGDIIDENLQQLEDDADLQHVYASFPSIPRPLPKQPTRLVGDMCAWHLQDTVFRTPRSEIWVKMSTTLHPLKLTDVSSCVLLDLLANVISDALNETVYLAEQASLELRVTDQFYGMDLCAGGFSHKLPDLLLAGLQKIVEFGEKAEWAKTLQDEGTRARLEAQREQLLRAYRNSYMTPGNHCADMRRILLMPEKHAAPDLAAALEAASLEVLADFAQQLIPKLQAEILIIGNATISDAQALIQTLPASLRQVTGCNVEHPLVSTAKVPIGTPIVWVEDSLDVGNRNLALELYWQMDSTKDVRPEVVLDLLEALMAEPLFDTLRTKQQLGYVVSCGRRRTHTVQGFSVWLMSCKAPPSEMCRRV